jgi:hypothetical protein
VGQARCLQWVGSESTSSKPRGAADAALFRIATLKWQESNMPDTTPWADEAQASEEGSERRQLEEHGDAVTDWRGRVRERPELWLGAAFLGGMLLGGALRTRSAERSSSIRGVNPAVPARGRSPVQVQASQFWTNLQGALVGVASARIQEYIDGMLPGFNEHYRRAEQRAAGVEPTAR